MNSQFKFKPDKIKYLSNVDTLDSTHKKITSDIKKKSDDVEKKKQKLVKLKNDLEELDKSKNEQIKNFIETRATLIENISKFEEEIFSINNLEEETEYYSKTYQILFNYYDMLDGLIVNEITDNCVNPENDSNIDIVNNYSNNTKNIYNNINNNCENINNNCNNVNIDCDNVYNNCDTNENSKNIISKNITSKNDVDEWELDGTQIFNSVKASKLDILYELSKKKRKEKKNTRKRVKNVESLIKDNNYDIFEFINSKNNNSIINNSNTENNSNTGNNLNNSINSNNYEYNVFDRAKLYDDYKIILDGYNSKKKHAKICENCNIDKVLIYSEGIHACLKCGEVENCIIECEIINYKEPMVEKPTFPYKRKNHFCEWKIIFLLLAKVIYKKNGYFLY